MSEDPPVRAVEKLIALVLVLAWTAATLAMTFPVVETVVPPYGMYFTALVFLLVGRLWNLEVDKLLPISGGGDQSDGGDDGNS
jgi:hypothetical protein